MSAEQEATTYSLSWDVEVRPLDSRVAEHKFLVCSADRQFAVTTGVAQLVEILREGAGTPAALAARLRHRGIAHATTELVDTLIRPLSAKGIVHDAAVAAPEAARPHSPVRLQRVLIRPGDVPTLVGMLAAAFRAPVAAVLLSAAVVAHVYFYARVFHSITWAVGSLPASHYLLLMALTTATTLVHELGHAAACRHYGCPHGAIGWGVYLFTPVFYTDVSAVWRLPRRQRAVVDVAGVYFEAVAAAVLLAGYLAGGPPILAYAFLLVDLSCLSQLTPILRRDGYWVVADLVGHTNLREASAHALQRSVARVLGRGPAAPALPEAGVRTDALVFIYTAVSVLLTAAFFGWVGTRVVSEAAPAVPRLAAALVAGPHDPASVAANALRLALHLFLLFLIAASAARFARSLAPWLNTGSPRGAGKPPFEKGATS